MQTLYLHDVKEVVLKPIQAYQDNTGEARYYREIEVIYDGGHCVITLFPHESLNQLQVTSEAPAPL